MSLKTIALRIGQAVLVIWATFTLSFILLAALPGDAVATRYDNPNLGLNAEQLAAIREVYGADEPILSRYFSALGGFLTGDFGFSVATGTAVSEMLADALPSTLALAVFAFLVGVVLAFLVAICLHLWPIFLAAQLFPQPAFRDGFPAHLLDRHHFDPDFLLWLGLGAGHRRERRPKPHPAGNHAGHLRGRAAGAGAAALHR